MTQRHDFGVVLAHAVPDADFDWLLPTAAVAKGYGVTEGAIRNQKSRRSDELLENVHWLKMPSSAGLYKVFWTKRGVIRLGFFLESEQAKAFRAYAESLVLGALNSRAETELPGKIVISGRGTCTQFEKPAAGLSQNVAMKTGQELQPTEPPIYPTKIYKQNHEQRNCTPYTKLIDEEEWEEDERSQFTAVGDSVQNRQPPNQNVNVTVIQSNDALTAVWSWAFMTAMACFLFGVLILFVAWLPEFMPHRQPSSQQEVR